MNIIAESYHLEERFNISQLHQKLTFSLVKSEPTYLFYKIEENTFLYIKDYGSIVFINCERNSKKNIINLITDSKIDISSLPSEKFEIIISTNKPQIVGFDRIYLKVLNEDTAQVISFNLAQSVVIDHYYKETDSLLKKITIHTSQLKYKGNIMLSFKEMRIFIGQTMNIKNRIAKNLYILETTDLAWSDEQLSLLDTELRSQLDIVNRYNELETNLNIVKENLDFFQAILQHKHSSKLEWIIIILILFEVLQVIVKGLF